MRLLIGFGSKARHGKDGCALAIMDHLNEHRAAAIKHGYPILVPVAKKISFADALRREVTAAINKSGGLERLLHNGFRDDRSGVWVDIPSWVTPTPNPDMCDPLLPHGKHSKLLQWWGTEYRRTQSQNYWVDRVAEQLIDFDGVALITDVRFPNEADYVKEAGGYTVNVTRVNENGSIFVAPDRSKEHISEMALDGYNWDFYIKIKNGDQALKSEYAITLVEYLLALTAGRHA